MKSRRQNINSYRSKEPSSITQSAKNTIVIAPRKKKDSPPAKEATTAKSIIKHIPGSEIAAGSDGLEGAGLGEPEDAAAGDVRVIVLGTVGREPEARRGKLEARGRPEVEGRVGRVVAEAEAGRAHRAHRADGQRRRGLPVVGGRRRGGRRGRRGSAERDVRVLGVAAPRARAQGAPHAAAVAGLLLLPVGIERRGFG